MIQRLALYCTLGLLCNALGYSASSDVFWMLLALFWAADLLGRREGYDDAMDTCQAILHKANDMLKEAQRLQHNKDTQQ